jgi:type IV conjugative transfer system coupling protein TraD
MAHSRQTPRVWSDAIRGSEILANWVKLGTSAVFLWLSIGIALGTAVGGFWFFDGTSSLDRRLWVHHVRNSLGVGGRIADLPNPNGSGTRIQVPKGQVQRYTWRSYDSVSRRFQESVFLGLLLAMGGTVTAAFFLRKSGRAATEDQHIRGATLAPMETVVALAKASKLAYDFTLAGVPIFRDAETDHVLVCGAPGSGKGVAIKELLDQIRARGDRAILYDPTGEYVQVYYRHSTDVLLNPLDARSRPWTLWGEVREAYDYASLAASIIPDNEKVNDPFWREGPRGLFEAVALRLAERGEATNAAFRHMISIAPLSELFALVKGTEAAPAIDPAAEKMAIGVRATVSTKIRAWAYLPDPGADEKAFSVRRFIEDEAGDAWLFLTSRKDQHAFLRPLLSLWCDQAAASILSLPPDLKRRFWVVMDEVASLQELPALTPDGGLLTMSRKHGGATILGLQDIGQLRRLYGVYGAQSISGSCLTRLMLRGVEHATAEWASQSLGEQEVNEATESLSMGPHDSRDAVNLQRRIVKRPIVLPSEIMNLPKLTGFLKLPGGYPVTKVTFQIRERKELAPIYVSRHGEVVF